MHAELRDALAHLGDARVVILTGCLAAAFAPGQDLNATVPWHQASPSRLGQTGEERAGIHYIRTLASLPQPVHARVNGVAAGAGANIALACDLVIAAKVSQIHPELFRIGPHSRQWRQLASSATGGPGASARRWR
jgi:2-(1,2-epoxy-1,2-dihydrophenyl)acetyl-CoA isomerase